MNISTIVIVIAATSLLATIFIVIANLRFLKGGLSNLDFKNVITQLVALTAWVTVLSKALIPIDPEKIVSSFVIFVTSLIIGGILIHNLGKEVNAKREVNSLIKKLELNNDKLKELDKQKSEFVSLASHQLRGPITIIQGYISMILEGDYGKVSDEVKVTLEKVFQTGTGLGFLINDYLDVSKLDKGEMEYVIQDINVSNLLDEIIQTFNIVATQNKIVLIKKYKETNTAIRGDQNKTRQIISNIIDNSLKYTAMGSITVDIESDSKFATIIVKDTGIGIDHDNLENVFQKFNRAKEAIDMSVVGTGLGLYVARVMTEAQDGKIWVESDGVGQGSTFYIKLPLSK